jgi:hypothetical protein
VRLCLIASKPTDSVILGFLPAAARLGPEVVLLTDQPEEHERARARLPRTRSSPTPIICRPRPHSRRLTSACQARTGDRRCAPRTSPSCAAGWPRRAQSTSPRRGSGPPAIRPTACGTRWCSSRPRGWRARTSCLSPARRNSPSKAPGYSPAGQARRCSPRSTCRASCAPWRRSGTASGRGCSAGSAPRFLRRPTSSKSASPGPRPHRTRRGNTCSRRWARSASRSARATPSTSTAARGRRPHRHHPYQP